MEETSSNWKSKLRYFACHRGANCACAKPDCRGKRPLNIGWQHEATCEPGAVEALRSNPRINVGILCGSASDLLVLDVDPDKGGNDSLAKLESELGLLPESYTVETGGGGTHRYFKHPLLVLRNAVSFLPGLDIRTTGGLVIAPGSLHQSGRKYTTLVDVEPCAMPSSWLSKIQRLQDEVYLSGKQKGLPACSSKVPEGQRNDFLFRIACSMRAKGFGEAAIRGALHAENREKCESPLPESEISSIVSSAAKFSPDEAKENSRPARPPLVVVASPDFLNRKFPEKEALLEADGKPVIWHPSAGEIHAYRGVGKSNFTYGLLRSVASGDDFLMMRAATPRRVLYVEGEMDGADMQAMAKRHGGHENLSILSMAAQPDQLIPSIASVEGRELIEEAIASCSAEVLGLDSMSTLANIPTNDDVNWLEISAWIVKLRARGTSVVYLHHDGKNGTQRGSSKPEDTLDYVMHLTWQGQYRGAEGLKAILNFEKARRKIPPQCTGIEIELREKEDSTFEWAWGKAGTSTRSDQDPRYQQITELKRAGKSTTEIAASLRISRQYVNQLLRKQKNTQLNLDETDSGEQPPF
jgi:hypothetical protein